MRFLSSVMGAGFYLFFAFSLHAGPELDWKPLREPGVGGWVTHFVASPTDANHLLIAGDMLGVGVSRDGGKNWEAGLGFKSGEMGEFTFNPQNPDEIWVGSNIGPYVSTDGGRHWELRRTGMPELSTSSGFAMPVCKVIFDPTTPGRMLGFNGNYRGFGMEAAVRQGLIYESRDSGKSWTKLGWLKKHTNILDAAFTVDGSAILAVAAGNGVWRSTDGGKTWVDSNHGLPALSARRLAVHPQDPKIIWLALGSYKNPEEKQASPGGIYKSTDGGLSWKTSSSGLAQKSNDNPDMATNFRAIAVAPSNPNILYTSGDGWDHHGGNFRSSDGGETWTMILSNKQGEDSCKTAYPTGPTDGFTLSVAPSDPNCILVAGSEVAVKSVDGGKTWIDVMATYDTGNKTWSGHGYSGLCSTNIAWNPKNANHVIVQAMDAGKMWISRDGAKTWSSGEGFSWPWGGSNDVSFSGPTGEVIYAALGQHDHFGSVGKSVDGGVHWIEQKGSTVGLPEDGEVFSVYATPDDADRVWCIMNHDLYFTTNGGAHWEKIEGVSKARRLYAVPEQAGHFLVASENGVYGSMDGKSFSLLPNTPVDVLRLAPVNGQPDTFLAASDQKIFRYKAGAVEKLADIPWAYDVVVDPRDSNRVAVASCMNPFRDVCDSRGVWLSEDGGKTFATSGRGIPVTRGWCIRFNPHDSEEIVFGTEGRGFFTARWARTSTK